MELTGIGHSPPDFLAFLPPCDVPPAGSQPDPTALFSVRTAINPDFIRGPYPMKNPYDVMRSKEQELLRLRKEMEALRIAARLLDAEDPAKSNDAQPQLSRVVEMP
jgi:hypothetical protein